jgi:serine/threonine-protein kinase SRK2
MQRPRPHVPATLANGRFIWKEKRVYTTETGNVVTILFVNDHRQPLEEEKRDKIKTVYGLEHPHIVSFSDVFYEGKQLCLVTSDVISNHLDKCASEEEAKWYFQQLVLVMDYCHRHDFQFDYRMENLYVTNNLLKVLPYAFYEFNYFGGSTVISMPTYYSPEKLRFQAADWKQQDVWAAGVLLMEMLTGTNPWTRPGERWPYTPTLMMQRIIRGDIILPTNISEDCRDLLKKILVTDPTSRITLEEIKNHPFFVDGLPVGALLMNDSVPVQDMPNIDEELNKFGRYDPPPIPEDDMQVNYWNPVPIVPIPAIESVDTPTTPRGSIYPSHAPMSL